MVNEINLAFAAPDARSQASSGPDPLDRISVRDYVKDIEIGAFQSERGANQHVQFNIVLEVASGVGTKFDDVDQILSYDAITDAIDDELSSERLNLLESLAERIAERVLAQPRAVRIFVRIEKLDRIPGALGVEIVRSKIDCANVELLTDSDAMDEEIIHPLVVFLPNAVLHSDELASWLTAVEAYEEPAIICLEQPLSQTPQTGVSVVDRRIGLLAIEQNAWVLASMDNRCVVVDSKTELDWAIKQGQMSVWAPSKIVLDAVEKPDASANTPLALAEWLSDQFEARQVVVCGMFEPEANSKNSSFLTKPTDL